MHMTIVYAHRPKRPPKKRKASALARAAKAATKAGIAAAVLMRLTTAVWADETGCFSDLNGKAPAQIHQLFGPPVSTDIVTIDGVDWVDESYQANGYQLDVGYVVQGGALKVGQACRVPLLMPHQ
jgi:hypothetical protein